MHELVVGQAVLPRGRIDAGDPERAHVALAQLAVAVLVRQRVHDRFVGGLEQQPAVTLHALGQLEDLLVAGTCGGPPLYSLHGLSSGLQVGRQATNTLHVCRRHLVLHVHDALALAALVLEHVRLERLAAHHLACAGDAKAFLCCLMSPDLWHSFPFACQRSSSRWSWPRPRSASSQLRVSPPWSCSSRDPWQPGWRRRRPSGWRPALAWSRSH